MSSWETRDAPTRHPQRARRQTAVGRSIVEAHGGTVSARSEPGVGACFWVELSAAPAPLPATSE